jgi:acetyl-CoA C-acetyltransferase
MQKKQARYGVASLCIGGGMGEALVVERDDLCR